MWAHGDFDGDSILDLARVTVAHRGGAVMSAGVDLFQRCAGSPVLVRSLLPTLSATLRVRDIDRDNDLDLVLGDDGTRQTIGLWINDGFGVFTETDPAAAGAAANPYSIERVPREARGTIGLESPRPGLEKAPPLALCEELRGAGRVWQITSPAGTPQVSTSSRGRAPPALSL